MALFFFWFSVCDVRGLVGRMSFFGLKFFGGYLGLR